MTTDALARDADSRMRLLVLAGAAAMRMRRGAAIASMCRAIRPRSRRRIACSRVRCSRCHTLARPLNAHITDPQHWIRYVARMRRQPGSGIDRTTPE